MISPGLFFGFFREKDTGRAVMIRAISSGSFSDDPAKTVRGKTCLKTIIKISQLILT